MEPNNNMYNWEAPKVAEALEAPSPFIEEGEIVYGQQGFDHYYLDTTSALLDSGKEFFSDIMSLNHERIGLEAKEKSRLQKKSDASLEEAAKIAAADHRVFLQKEMERKMKENDRRRKEMNEIYSRLGEASL